MNMGPLMVMSGNDIGIRVGSSDTNLMSWVQWVRELPGNPHSGPMHMIHKQSGDWLLMFHYSLVRGMNRQGGSRGVTKLSRQTGFMRWLITNSQGNFTTARHFSFEPFTFPPGARRCFLNWRDVQSRPLIDKAAPA